MKVPLMEGNLRVNVVDCKVINSDEDLPHTQWQWGGNCSRKPKDLS